jgi:hypothetical protein
MVEEVRIYRGALQDDCFYIATNKIALSLVRWESGQYRLFREGNTYWTIDDEDFPQLLVNPSTPFEMLVVSGFGVEQILRQGKEMEVRQGQSIWMTR